MGQRWILAGLLVMMFVPASQAGRTRNGNELALELSSVEGDEREQLVEDSLRSAFYFRYLLITNLVEHSTNGQHRVEIDAVEPSSFFTVRFVVSKSVSLRKIRELSIEKGDGIAVTGRLQSFDSEAGTIVLDPVIVRHKDKLSPAVGKELLHEVDPHARTATDTSTGKEVVTRPEGVTTNRAPRASRQ